ncbi:MAG: hypothetical protein IIB81_03445, partial [Nanoarchaeota archaeon]|nr:hypothetical protein [Nanoarchaeota archaeon]
MTSLQHNVVKDALNRCAFTKPVLDEEGNPVKDKKNEETQKLIISLDPWHIARLFDLL